MLLRKTLEYFKYDLWRVMRPLAYHGEGKAGPFFEGWYFKLVSSDGGHRMSVIPGIYRGKDHSDSHAFVQVIDGVDGSSHYVPFPISAFTHIPKEMDVSIAANRFTRNGIELDLHDGNFSLRGKIRFSELSQWPVTFSSPGVMGWYAWVPGMECYHGIVSMDHRVDGKLNLNNRSLDFTAGRGYMEKDWGRAMPSAWVWMQSNHFMRPRTSLTFSIAHIPWGRRSFVGFLGGFLLDGKLYRFATYTGARVGNFNFSDASINLSIRDRTKILEITAHRARGFNLQAPTTIQMDRRIMETLSAEVEVVFSHRMDGRWVEVFSGKGKYAGLEAVGDISSLI